MPVVGLQTFVRLVGLCLHPGNPPVFQDSTHIQLQNTGHLEGGLLFNVYMQDTMILMIPFSVDGLNIITQISIFKCAMV